MAGEPNRLAPPVIWAQRKDKLYVTINVEDCQSPVIKFGNDSVYFCGKGGTANKEYEVTLELFGEIKAEECQYAVLARHIPLIVRKTEEGYWPRLLKKAEKVHWLKTDFNKWRDEDDSDADEGGNDMQFEEMMKSMGNFNTEGNGMEADDEEDSDDEDLPDLETQ